MHRTVLIITLLCLAHAPALTGCDTIGGINRIAGDDVDTLGTPASTSKIGLDGEQVAGLLGESPTLVKLDDSGIWKNSAGATRTLGINPATGQVFADTSEDVSFERFEFTPQPAPGQASLIIVNLNARQTELTKAKLIGYEAAVEAIKTLSAEQAKAVIDKWKTAGMISEAVADAALKAALPVPIP